jgi:hypothetical protein
VWGIADWGSQDAVYDDGGSATYSWVHGELYTDEGHRPAWFVGDRAPNIARGWNAYADGETLTTLSGSVNLEDPAIDAVSLTSLTVGSGCTDVSGIASVHARGGHWYDLTITETAEDCRACGDVTGSHGEAIGTACIDVSPILDDGDRP